MKDSIIALLEAVRAGTSDVKDLQNASGLKKTQFYDSLKYLMDQDYIEKKDSLITFKINPKSILYRDVAAIFNAQKLLHDSNEDVFISLITPATIHEIQKATGLSYATVHRSISELLSIGAITKDNDRYNLITEKDKLVNFAKILKLEKDRSNQESYAEVIFQNKNVVLKRVPKGRKTDGELTGFSMFTEYGVEYHTTHDYYVKQEGDLTLSDILIHAVVSASKDRDKNGMIMTMIFYLKNKEKLDPLMLRGIARLYDIRDVWLDIENYIRNNELKSATLFPPRGEFIEKADLYLIPEDAYVLPNAYPELFREIGRNLTQVTSVFLIGGENMRLKGLKARTKDCDIVTNDSASYDRFVQALKKMDYKSLNASSLSEDDKRLNASDILVHEKRSRIDLFMRFIGKDKFYLSDRMVQRAKIESFGKLRLGILHDSDVFLLKCIAAREGDIDDMARIAQSTRFNWDLVLEELEKQEHETRFDLSSKILDGIDDLVDYKGIVPPFYKKLVNRAIDKQIDKLLLAGDKPLKEVVEVLKGRDVSERLIRSRVEYLQRIRHLEKMTMGNEVILRPKMRGPMNTIRLTPISDRERVMQRIDELSQKLRYPGETQREAIRMLDKLNNLNSLIGQNPRAVAAGIMSIAGTLTGHDYSPGVIRRAARISQPSYNRSISRIKRLLRY